MNSWFEIVIDLLVRRSYSVMSLVGDNHVESVGAKFIEPSYEGLDRSTDNFFTVGSSPCLFESDGTVEVFYGLIDEFLSVCEHESATRTFQLTEYDCLAQPRCHLHEVTA